ncbi:SDR family oxidoreductase [Reichenbachiella agariperforans]|uniref:SDR family oxidoreductase n=1 Tax=Reichenbachiella agariperforans TaxID=156994 RepID=UPI001C0808BB|nr:SDR family oxidoreductase [Reichenbachiella agariperforans]MBU2915568.1 SDR family oxidoreductase [Reichenbachiella agariperforans]
MKVLITGANGLLGQKLVKLLLDKGEEVIATSHGKSRLGYLEQSFEYARMDITQQAEVLEVIQYYQPDVVVNTAAMTNVDQCETAREECRQLNVDAVQYLVDACRLSGSFLVHLSTDFIFDGEAGPYTENDPAKPLSYYGQSKLDAETIVQDSGIDWSILRTVLVYGITPGMSRSNIVLWVKSSLEEGKELKIVDDQWRTPTLAEDLAMGCYLSATKRAQGIFNISGKDMLTPYDMAMKTCDYFELDKAKITKVDGSTFTQTAKRPPKTGFVIEKARLVLGYEPVSFDEGIQILDTQVRDLAV